MRWLQWSTLDLASGLGGVEVHARCMNRELKNLGIHTEYSRDPKDLNSKNWDVIQIHGQIAHPLGPLVRENQKPVVRVYTLHGTTLGRMAACHESLWLGGYRAASLESWAVLRSDVVLAVHPKLHLLNLAKTLGKTCGVVSNGWDSGQEEVLPALLLDQLAQEKYKKGFWVYVGRGGDRVKATQKIQNSLGEMKDLQLVAAPGEGFFDGPQILKTGNLTSGQVRSLMRQSTGLILSSLYEGLPLVVLEALALGVTVVSTPAGGVTTLPADLQGFYLAQNHTQIEFKRTWDLARKDDHSDNAARRLRAEHNQSRLNSWKKVAEISLETVSRML